MRRVPLRFAHAPTVSDDQQQHADAAPAPRQGRVRGGGVRTARGPGGWPLVALMLVLAAYLLFAALIMELAGESAERGGAGGRRAVIVALRLRLLRVGVWVSGDGLRLVSLLRTTTVAWDRVGCGAHRAAAGAAGWRCRGRCRARRLVVTRRADGSELPTLLTDHSADFLRRPSPSTSPPTPSRAGRPTCAGG